MPGRYTNDDGPAAGGERLRGPIFEGGYFKSRYIRNIASEILAKKYCLKPPEKILPHFFAASRVSYIRMWYNPSNIFGRVCVIPSVTQYLQNVTQYFRGGEYFYGLPCSPGSKITFVLSQ